MENFISFLVGWLMAGIVILPIFARTQPEIKHEELYRFCLIKNIKLEDCKIPDSPYEINKQIKAKE